MVYCFQTSGAQPVAVPQILNWMGSEEKMVFVCDHCHFELEAGAKPSQCPDCGKMGYIRPATLDESRAFQARKREDVWHDAAPAMAG